MLVFEVSEPTVLGISLGMLSISSAGVRDGSDTEVSRRDLEVAGSSCRALGVWWPLMALSRWPDDGDSVASCFAFSRSIALSLAAFGAAGKNCAKLALEGRVIVSKADSYIFTTSTALQPS